ncbi:ABC transporter ATP-binding protein [soil metagenome]
MSAVVRPGQIPFASLVSASVNASVISKAEATLLRVQGLHAGYGSNSVLHDISFSVVAGEILAIVGPNGAGKTTLLRCIAGLLKVRSGSVQFNGVNITYSDTPEIVSSGFALAPEGRRLFGGLSVEANLRLGTYRRQDKSRATVDAALEEVFHFFPRLRERRRQLAGTMSGGEQQMCAIGRALMSKPTLLAIDELSLGLAPVIVAELVEILDGVRAKGTTVLLVEQDVSVALRLADSAIVIESGQVAMRGSAADVLANDQIIKSYLGG